MLCMVELHNLKLWIFLENKKFILVTYCFRRFCMRFDARLGCHVIVHSIFLHKTKILSKVTVDSELCKKCVP